MHNPIKSGAIIPVLIMLPNIIWFALPHPATSDNTSIPLVLNIAENAGRIAILIIPFFYSLTLKRRFSLLALIPTSVALMLYYAAWIRYFTGGQTALLMGASFIGIPLPLAVAPTVLLLFSSYLLGSWPMLVASIWFGVAHIWVSALTL
jgi:hypothetical protein